MRCRCGEANQIMSKSAWMTYDGPKPVLPLSDTEHSAVAFAWRALTAVAEVEDLWEIVVQNYMELESTLLRSALQSMVGAGRGHSQGQDERLRITRPLSNLLSSCRAYFDQVKRNLRAADCGDFADTFKQLASREYDANPSYAFMEALRNYAQHCGLPLHGTTIGGSWSLIETERGLEKGTYRFSASASIALDKLQADPEFKNSALAKFAGRDRLDVARLTREYIESLSQVQADLRDEMAASVTGWKGAVRSLLAQYAIAAECEPHFIMIGEYSGAEPSRGTQLFEGMLSRIEEMSKRNPALINLSRRYVSTELAE